MKNMNIMVREAGLEPAQLMPLDPKSSASSNSATLANIVILLLFYKEVSSVKLLFKFYQSDFLYMDNDFGPFFAFLCPRIDEARYFGEPYCF